MKKILFLGLMSIVGCNSVKNTSIEEVTIGQKDNIYIDATATNILYLGLDNPVTLKTIGEDINEISLISNDEGAIIKNMGQGKFTVQPSKFNNNFELTALLGSNKTTQHFFTQRIPSPVAQLGRQSQGNMGSGEFKSQTGIRAVLNNFTIDAKCSIVGFTLTRISESGIKSKNVNREGKYSDKSKILIEEASAGDIYLYDNVTCRCPKYPAPALIPGIIIRIK